MSPLRERGDEGLARPPTLVEMIYGGSRGIGKKVFLDRAMAEWLRDHPEATIARISGRETLIEKHVEGETVNDAK